MQSELSSRHLRGATELMLLIPIRSGLVASFKPISYATRLRALLNTLFELRRKTVEEDLLEGSGPIERLQSIFATQWAVLDDEQPAQLLVNATFDRSWEDYVQLLVTETGSLLDAIFCHCVGYAGYTCADGHEQFSTFLRAHQLRCDLFHVGMPDLTLDDLRYFKKAATRLKPDERLGEMTIGSAWHERSIVPNEEEHREAAKQALLGKLGDIFPNVPEFDDTRGRTAHDFLLSALDNLLKKPTQPDWKRYPRELTKQDVATIQGGILTPYKGMTHGCVLLVQCADREAICALLDRALPNVTTHATAVAPQARLNVALTHAGLQRLELSEPALALFPKEFREGMAARAGLLGDIGPDHPKKWQVLESNWEGKPSGKELDLGTIDVVLTIQAPSDPQDGDHEWSANHPLRRSIEALGIFDSFGAYIVHVQPLRRFLPEDGKYREHFGFLETGDSKTGSQPVPDVSVPGQSLPADTPSRDIVPLGELLLGHPNRHGALALCADPAHSPYANELFKNGSFLVMRKLDQDVESFNKFTTQAADLVGTKSDRIGALLLGRDHDGKALTATTITNNFQYDDGDEKGQKCPLHAHIRRANPREAGVVIPRIMRRGFSYGTPYSKDPAGKRGLLFQVYNGSIAGQFEIVQRWLNGGNSTGILSAQNDLMTGTPQPTGATRWVNIDDALRTLPQPSKPFVSLRWGLYLFVPSVDAIRWMIRNSNTANGNSTPAKGPSAAERLVARGEKIIRALDALQDPAIAIQEWKRVLEEPACRVQASAVWAALRKAAPVKSTPYGVLVATMAGAQEVLTDPGTRFSVREYWRRLERTMGEHYLAFDLEAGHLASEPPDQRDVRYEERLKTVSYIDLSTTANEYLATLGANAGADTLDYGREVIRQCPDNGVRRTIDVVAFATAVVANVAHEWIGLPVQEDYEDADLVRLIGHFVVVSQYSFQPHPDAWLENAAQKLGQELQSKYEGKALVDAPMAKDLRSRGVQDDQRIRQAMIGAIVGFAAPAIASIVSVISQWASSNELLRLTQLWSGLEQGARLKLLSEALLRALILAPVPPILYRTALEGVAVGGSRIKPGSMVVIGVHSACVDAEQQGASVPWQWIFGGEHGGGHDRTKPPHGCPARSAAIQVMLGAASSLLERVNLRAEDPYTLSCDSPDEQLDAVNSKS